MAYWVDDGFDTWPEVVRAGKAATGLYVCCGAWIARNIGNGTLTEPVVPAEIASMYGTPEWVAKLVAAGLWTTEEAGYRDVHYFRMGNPTADVVQQRRAAAARRQALVRDPALREAIRSRDKDRCRYCSAAVRWNDRKGGKGGTYDHIDPAGPNLVENIVVACRACNSAKRDRTPDEAGMPLRPPPNLDTNKQLPISDSGQNLDSSRSPTLPPPKGGKGAHAPAQTRDADTAPPQPQTRGTAPICPTSGNRTNTPYHLNNCAA